MLKKIVLITLVIINGGSLAKANDFKFEGIQIDDFASTKCPIDSNAGAHYILNLCHVDYKISTETRYADEIEKSLSLIHI